MKITHTHKEPMGLRKQSYPKLEEFADAYYWMQRGDPKPMEAYLAKIDDVKKKIPKGGKV